MMIPNFLKGKNNDDLAPMITLISPLETPLQISSFFFFEIFECQTAGLNPKYSKNFCSNWPVNPISGIKLSLENPSLLKVLALQNKLRFFLILLFLAIRVL